jgi:hypothetical protein
MVGHVSHRIFRAGRVFFANGGELPLQCFAGTAKPLVPSIV